MGAVIVLQLIISIILIIAVALPTVRNSYWIFRILEYPRFQLWVMVLIVLFSWLFTFNNSSPFTKIVAGLLLAGFLYLCYKIWPYTPLSKRQVLTVKPGKPENQVKLYTANVYQDNHDYQRIIQQIRKYDPDIIVLVETDEAWKKHVDVLLDTHPFYIGKPLENTYGMILYSRLEIKNEKLQFLVEDDIPSIEATMVLPSKQQVNFWVVHPKPPVPGESDDSRAKDSEIMKIAFRAKESKLPVIVMGDFNDVAWSKVTELFQKTAALLDPRRGRGFYSTFSAYSHFVRFPLDYIFCSTHFGLVRMKRMPKNGSDHFAILTHLVLDSKLDMVQDAEEATSEDLEEAREKERAA